MSRVTERLVPSAEAANRAVRTLGDACETACGAGSWVWSLASDEMAWSRNAVRIFGVGREEVAGSATVVSLSHPDDRERVALALEGTRRGDPMPDLHFRLLLQDGRTRFVQTHVALDERAAGDACLTGLLLDLTAAHDQECEIAAHAAVSRAAGHEGDPATLVDRLLAELTRAMAFSDGVLFVPDRGRLVERARWPAPVAGNPPSGAIGADMIHDSWTRRSPVASSTHRPALKQSGRRGAVAIPVIAGVQVLAVLGFAGPDTVILSAGLAAMLTRIGEAVGVLLELRPGLLSTPILSRRELEVLQLAAHGRSGPEIAERLHISPTTVKSHFEKIYVKYDVTDRVAAVARALREGLIH